MRKIATIKENECEVRTYRDPDQYIVKAYENGILQTGSEYYTDDKSDAQNTALDMLSRLTNTVWQRLLGDMLGIASAAINHGTTIDALASEFANTPCEWMSDYACILDSRGHWWTDDRLREFTTWVDDHRVFDPANPRWNGWDKLWEEV